MNFHNTEFSTLCVQIINGFLNGFSPTAHNNDNLFSIRSAIVINNVILTAGNFCKFIHFFLNNTFNGVVIFISSFTPLEEDIRVLCGTANNRGFRTESVFCVELIINTFKHSAQIVIRKEFNFFDFVRSTETIKEVHKRHARTQSRSLRNSSHIVSFLHGVRAEHSKSGLTAAHHVRVITKDGQSVISQRTGSHVHNERRKFAGDFVHIRDHQEQALRRCKSCSQRTGLESTVASTCGTCFGLHFLHIRNNAPKVLLFSSRPRIGPFTHRRRRGNRVDNADFIHAVSNRSGRFVTIHHFHFHF